MQLCTTNEIMNATGKVQQVKTGDSREHVFRGHRAHLHNSNGTLTFDYDKHMKPTSPQVTHMHHELGHGNY